MGLYIVNMNFDTYLRGEIIEAQPELVADWVEVQFISPCDEHGQRIIDVEAEA